MSWLEWICVQERLCLHPARQKPSPTPQMSVGINTPTNSQVLPCTGKLKYPLKSKAAAPGLRKHSELIQKRHTLQQSWDAGIEKGTGGFIQPESDVQMNASAKPVPNGWECVIMAVSPGDGRGK